MIEKRHAELRAAPGRRLMGRAMPYGTEALARVPGVGIVRERFAVFAFADYLETGAATQLNLQHDKTLTIASTAGETRSRGLLVLRDHPDGLDLEARFPSGDVFDQVLDLVAGGDTAETSIEFRAVQDVVADGRRVVQIATLPSIAIVDRGAYRGSVEVRADGRRLEGRFDYEQPRTIRDRGRTRKSFVKGRAFRKALDDFQELQKEVGRKVSSLVQARIDEISDVQVLAGRSYDRPLGSMKAGTLELNDTDKALHFSVQVPRTTYGDDLLAALDEGAAQFGVDPLYRPWPDSVSTIPEPGNPNVDIEVVEKATLTALAIVSRAPKGNPGMVRRRPAPEPRRALVWL